MNQLPIGDSSFVSSDDKSFLFQPVITITPHAKLSNNKVDDNFKEMLTELINQVSSLND